MTLHKRIPLQKLPKFCLQNLFFRTFQAFLNFFFINNFNFLAAGRSTHTVLYLPIPYQAVPNQPTQYMNRTVPNLYYIILNLHYINTILKLGRIFYQHCTRPIPHKNNYHYFHYCYTSLVKRFQTSLPRFYLYFIKS